MSETQSTVGSHIPAGLPPNREAVLRHALAEVGTREKTGRNDGPVEKYMPAWARGRGLPYCAFFGGWTWEQVFGVPPYGKRLGGAWDVYQAAKLKGELFHTSGPTPYAPIPGDAAIVLHDKDGNLDTRDPGHFVFVLRVSEDGKRICTVEGNFQNRVGCAQRLVTDFAGFVNPYERLCGEGDAFGWHLGLFDAPHAGGLANTR
jgi:hypothetical protein